MPLRRRRATTTKPVPAVSSANTGKGDRLVDAAGVGKRAIVVTVTVAVAIAIAIAVAVAIIILGQEGDRDFALQGD